MHALVLPELAQISCPKSKKLQYCNADLETLAKYRDIRSWSRRSMSADHPAVADRRERSGCHCTLQKSMSCPWLFVYGTLRHGFELHKHLQRLGAKLRMEAKVRAELFDLGRYPGARPALGKGKWVHGEVYRLRQPASDLRVLDEIEGVAVGAPQSRQFVRATAEVTLKSGARMQAWIYWLGAKGRVGRRRIACGDFAARQAPGKVTQA